MWNTIRNKIKGQKTVLINTLAIVVSVLEVSNVTSYMSDAQMLQYLMWLAGANIILRVFATSTPYGKSE